MQDGILSIQSAVAYGHVGNSAAVFPLQRLGFEVWPVNTVLFSNHTGYGAWRGRVVGARTGSRRSSQGIAERGAIPHVRAVLSGYLGDPSLGEAVLRTVARVRAERPDMVYACDPVMGDEGRGFFVRPGIPEFFRDHAVPAADIVTPNQFELAWLAGRPIAAMERRARRRRQGARHRPRASWSAPASLVGDRGPARHPGPQRRGQLGRAGRPGCRSPSTAPATRSPPCFSATGWRRGGWIRRWSGRSRPCTRWSRRPTSSGSRELELVAAQDQLVNPRRQFRAERVR